MRTEWAVETHQITAVHTPGGTRLTSESGTVACMLSMVAA
jgi:hypothetical protein